VGFFAALLVFEVARVGVVIVRSVFARSALWRWTKTSSNAAARSTRGTVTFIGRIQK
jgi:hypothetical protein